MQNEFTTWFRKDKHAKAYNVLFNERSQRIARNLGLGSAHTAAVCLDCHTDNVSPALRGKRFQLSDGVGCEACHGGGERYLGPHVSGENAHKDNMRMGLYPTEDPEARAELCLSCHLGTKDKFAAHRILGAGHPRLSFELDTFTQVQPAHYQIDKDYRERKSPATGIQVWAIGQVLAAEHFVDLYLNPKNNAHGAFPEFAFYDCHNCHRAIKGPDWHPRDSKVLDPGLPHLNDSSFRMLECVIRPISPDIAQRLKEHILSLHLSSELSVSETQKAIRELRPLLTQVRELILQHVFTPVEMRAVLRGIVRAGARDEYSDYGDAEQAVEAVTTIVDALAGTQEIPEARKALLKTSIQELMGLLDDENAYRPERLLLSFRKLDSSLE